MKASKAIEMKLELIEKICGLVLNSKGPRNLSAGFVAMVKRNKTTTYFEISHAENVLRH